MAELSLGTLVILAALILAAVYIISPESFQKFLSQTTVTQTETGSGTTTGTVAGTTEGTGETQEELYPIDTVNIFVMDALNPKSGVASVEVEVLEPVPGKTPEEVASDPMRVVVDEDTATDSSGKATFSNGMILAKTPYIYSVRGDTTVYDYITIKSVPINPAGKSLTYTFPDRIYVYRVGNFSDILPSTVTYSG